MEKYNVLFVFQLKIISVLQMEVNFTAGNIYNLTGLKASTEYGIALRCRDKLSRIWSDWSQEKTGMTEDEGKQLLVNSLSVFCGMGVSQLYLMDFSVFQVQER